MKAAFHTLGCKVNQYETEAIKEQFRALGWEIGDEEEVCDAYVINTCTVTNLADRKSRQFIRRARRLNPDALVAVTGCYAQIKPEEVAAIEGVEIVTGTDEKGKLAEMVDARFREEQASRREAKLLVKPYEKLDHYESLGEIREMESRTRAFIKIQEGCNNFCTYCIIPYARGKIRSRAAEDVIEEVRNLVAKGYKEIVLTGINTAFYGQDLGYGGIEPLIAGLDALEGDFRIRLSSLEPTVIDAAYVKGLMKYPKLCHHLHLALQSGSDHVLSEMNRHYTRQDFLNIVKVLREADPHYGISTDIIVGFPGETEDEFRDSLRIVSEASFCKTHVFKYSMRTGTPAAARTDQVPGETKNDRSRALIAESDRVRREFFLASRGETRRVLFEEFGKDPVTGEDQGMDNGDGDDRLENRSESRAEDRGAENKVRDDRSESRAEDKDRENRSESRAEDAAVLFPDGCVTGYTDNYIRVYANGGPALFDQFRDVELVRPYRDGMLGRVR